MLAPLPVNEDDLLSRVEHLAQGVFLERARDYDRSSAFPAENFDDLFARGLMAPLLPLQLHHSTAVLSLQWVLGRIRSLATPMAFI